MKIKHFGWRSGFVAATWAVFSIGFSLPVRGQILGDCSERTCQELLDQLRLKWPDRISKFEGKCTPSNLGLDIWSNSNTQSKKVALLCWGEEDTSGVKIGDLLGVLPFPGDEASFPSPLSCISSSDRSCEELLAKIKARLPDEVKQYEFNCAEMAGDLNLSISEGKAEAHCIFPTSVFVDENGDEKPDSEQGIMHLVDIVLGSFPLDKL